MLAPRKLLQGRYRIITKAGGGGTSTVYEATDERLRNKVAVKESLHGYDPTTHRAFNSEASVLSKLKHPLLPRVIDYFEESGRLYLIMDFIPGDHLGELLKQRHSFFDLSQVLLWADQLLEVLEYIHSYQPPILHHDIKPQNLKLFKGGKIILLDFGLVKGALAQLSRTTGTSIFGYTEQYSPLEQIQGKPTDTRSDLFSLAATLYYLMTNVQPPSALDRAMALSSNGVDPLQSASQVNSLVPPSIANILHKAMSLVADQRPASANEMRQNLRAAYQPSISNLQAKESVIIHRDKYNIVGYCDAPVTCIAFSPDGKQVAAGSKDGLVRIWDISTGQYVLYEWVSLNTTRTTISDIGVSTLIYSPDGKYIAASSNDKFVKVWDLQAKNSYLLKKKAPVGYISYVPIFTELDKGNIELAFSPSNAETLLAVYDKAIYYWDFLTDQQGSNPLNLKHNHCFAILPDGKQVTEAMQRLDVIDIRSGQKQTVYENKFAFIALEKCIAISLDGRYVATGGIRTNKKGRIHKEGGLGVWEVQTGKELLLKPCDSEVKSISISPDNRKVVTGSIDKKIRCWDLASGNESVLGECGQGINAVVYSQDGKHIATGSDDLTVRIWDLTV